MHTHIRTICSPCRPSTYNLRPYTEDSMVREMYGTRGAWTANGSLKAHRLLGRQNSLTWTARKLPLKPLSPKHRTAVHH